LAFTGASAFTPRAVVTGTTTGAATTPADEPPPGATVVAELLLFDWVASAVTSAEPMTSTAATLRPTASRRLVRTSFCTDRCSESTLGLANTGDSMKLLPPESRVVGVPLTGAAPG
jgi:hypothetical protein